MNYKSLLALLLISFPVLPATTNPLAAIQPEASDDLVIYTRAEQHYKEIRERGQMVSLIEKRRLLAAFEVFVMNNFGLITNQDQRYDMLCWAAVVSPLLSNELIPTQVLQHDCDLHDILVAATNGDFTEDNYKIFQCLIKRKFPVNKVCKEEEVRNVRIVLLPQLILCSQPPNEAVLKIARLLVNNPDVTNRVDINERFVNSSEYVQTPLHYAAAAGEVAWVTWLLEQGAEPMIPDSNDKTPLECEQANINCSVNSSRVSEWWNGQRDRSAKQPKISEHMQKLFEEHERKRRQRKRYIRNRLYRFAPDMPPEVRELCADYV